MSLNLRQRQKTHQLHPISINLIDRQIISPLTDYYTNRVQFTQKDINQIFYMLTLKDTHLFQLFSNNTTIVQKFKKKHMCNNSYMKIGIRKILYDLANQRRIGKNLKGMSKTILHEIENKIWDILQLEIKIFRKDQEISRCADSFSHDLDEFFKF